ncbi:MAG: hypothetical protein DMG32_26015 [Acidobacteria bacterium]|nr:MAG: hypothetical protein DMG32_26015 [Acidobacteriota bacterium]
MLHSRTALRVEVSFLRKQLDFYEERQLLPRLLNDSARAPLVLWSRLFDWRDALVIAHPTAAWTLQQFREGIPSDYPYRWVIRDRDSIFSEEVDDQS